MSNPESFYDKSSVTSIEQAVLAEDIYFSEIKNIDGKFFIKVLTPMVDSTKLTTRNKAGITSTNYITLTIPAYMLLHFASIKPTTIKVPTKFDTETGLPTKYKTYKTLAYSFKNEDLEAYDSGISTKNLNQFVIPKGTIFFVEFLGGLVDADKCYIVGISQFSLIQ